jgi:hypothetical protein
VLQEPHGYLCLRIDEMQMLWRFSSPMYFSHTIYNLQISVSAHCHTLHVITEVMAIFVTWFHFLDFNLTCVYYVTRWKWHSKQTRWMLRDLDTPLAQCQVILFAIHSTLKLPHSHFSPYYINRARTSDSRAELVYLLARAGQGNIQMIKPVYTSCLKV